MNRKLTTLPKSHQAFGQISDIATRLTLCGKQTPAQWLRKRWILLEERTKTVYNAER